MVWHSFCLRFAWYPTRYPILLNEDKRPRLFGGLSWAASVHRLPLLPFIGSRWFYITIAWPLPRYLQYLFDALPSLFFAWYFMRLLCVILYLQFAPTPARLHYFLWFNPVSEVQPCFRSQVCLRWASFSCSFFYLLPPLYRDLGMRSCCCPPLLCCVLSVLCFVVYCGVVRGIVV